MIKGTNLRNIETDADLSNAMDAATLPDGDKIVFWEGHSTGNPNSGIGHEVSRLAEELIELGVRPIVLSDPSIGPIPGLPSLHLPPLTRWLSQKLQNTPVLHAERSWRRLVEIAEAYPNRSFILHAHGNINLPTGLRRRHRRISQVLTVQDIIPLLAPGGSTRKLQWQFRWALPRAVRSVDRILCISEWTRGHVVSRCPIALNKTDLLRCGRDERTIRGAAPRPASTSTCQLLCISRFETYKRLDFLVSILSASKDLRLTLVTDRRGYDHFNSANCELIATERLKVLSNVDEERLNQLIATTDCYVQASQLEGFCLPALDALRHGRPVVYQSGSGIDEVCGQGAAQPMPPDATPAQWVEAIEAMIRRSNQPDFSVRVTEQLQSIPTWADSAKSLLSVYQRLKGSELDNGLIE